MTKHYFLFDIDGVLLSPGGYRKAAEDTILFFLQDFGFAKGDVDENNFPVFESMEITSEWDMIPLYLLASLELFFEKNNLNQKLNTKADVAAFVQGHGGQIQNPVMKIKEFLPFLEDGKSKAECVFERKNTQAFLASFPNIYTYAGWIIELLLKDAGNPQKASTLWYFQNLILGNVLFEEIFQTPAVVDTESYLSLFDKNNLDENVRAHLLSLIKSGKMVGAAMTARPTGIPGGIDHDQQIYFPEGELGIDTVDLNSIPVIGFGHLTYLSSKVGGSGETYLKPSPIHALSAIFATHGISEVEAVNLAYQVYEQGDTQENRAVLDPLFLEPFTIYIFEDATGGIRSVKNLVKLLSELGYLGNVVIYGITQDVNKAEALRNENAAIYPDINAALSKGLSLVI